MKKYYHGENSITFSILSEFNAKQISLLLSNNVAWTGSVFKKKENIEYIHLFPNFGKRYGYGEPDAIIITSNFIIFIEVELADLTKHKIPDCFIKQMRQFVLLANDLSNTNKKRLRKKFTGESGYSFYGKRPLRRLFKQIKSKKRKSAFLVISDGKDLDPAKIVRALNINKEIIIGWIGFNKLKRMEITPDTVKIINDNIESR